MSVPIPTSRSSYAPGGATTVFSTGFYFLDSSEVVVKLTPSGGAEVVQTEGVHYTVTEPADVGSVGSITMLVAPPAASALVIERTVPYTQATSFRTAGTFSRAVHEDAMDEVVFQTQQLARRISDLESAGAPGSVVAGNGLAFSGATLHAGAGNGVQVNADNIEVLYGPATGTVYGGGAYNGVEDTAARSDHGHTVVLGAALDLHVGDVADPGVGTGLALGAHVHGVPVGAPVAVDAAAAVTGASGNFSDAAHKHQVSTGVPVSLTDATNGAGAANALAKSDHTHAHGARGGGTLHAVATPLAAGFMSATDKTRLDALSGGELLTRVIAAHAGYQNIPTGFAPWTLLAGLTETVDADAEFDGTTYTAKHAGYVLLTAIVESDNVIGWPIGSSVWLAIRKNGAQVLYNIADNGLGTGAFFVRKHVTISHIVPVAPGDTLELWLGHSCGVNQDFRADLAISRLP